MPGPRTDGPIPNQTANKKLETSLRREESRRRHQDLQDDVQAAIEEHNQKIQEIAEKHGQKERAVEDMAKAKSVYAKKPRKISLYNAALKSKAREYNSSREKGDWKNATSLNQEVANDPKLRKILDNPTKYKDEAAKLIADVQAQRELESRGPRSSKKAAAIDAAGAMGRIGTELNNLESRTNARGFAIITRGHVNDTVMPGFAGTLGAAEFTEEVLGLSMPEFVKKLEQWETSRDRDEREAKLRNMQKASAKMIADGLMQILGKKVKISYKSYDTDIRRRYKVQIHTSWPTGVRFCKPSSINAMEGTTLLHTALTSGECAWVKMTRQEVEELEKTLQEAGPAKKMPRSDKGGSRRKRTERDVDDGSDEDDNQRRPLPKKRKNSKVKHKLPPSFKSPAIVPDSDEDDEGSEDE